MTRIPPIVFALLLGLFLGWFLYFFLFIDGPTDHRLTTIGLFSGIMVALAWFQARRVFTKSVKEQRKQRLIAVALMFALAGGLSFLDYKSVQKQFLGTCTQSADIYTCRCIERKTLPFIWFDHMKLRPRIAMGEGSADIAWSVARRPYREAFTAASQACRAR